MSKNKEELENELANIIWDVSRQELCTNAHKKDAKCIVMVTNDGVMAVSRALMTDSNFQSIVKQIANCF